MIKARRISKGKLTLIVFSALLPVNFLAMVCVGWNDQGAMENGFIVSTSRAIDNIILFPMHAIERVFHLEPFADTLFFIFDIICLALWAVLLVSVFRFFQQKTQKPKPKKRSTHESV
ncbi:hypothetical protein KXQ82_01250 [Mucilaginibacter sp. HMF5004]|uniref:hypothetical protein n=1 Tax=Mucilaginibacter rivuli TaxID=2857527 RepID=UPI001C5DB3EB|nr:hypothetical protein [Mucilaginibacter rivuli]MBW4888315.1 hypothetical protein [Mucilaginibacter rivuli]